MHRALLEQCYHAALRAADPRAATAAAVSTLALGGSPAIIATGKAAVGMARGALDALQALGLASHAGLVVSHETGLAAVGPLPHCTGSHPVPDEASFAAAAALARAVPPAREAGDVIVLVSGGTTSLIAAPVDGVSRDDLRLAFDVLLGCGAPINVVNAVRRRILRWGAGRLALALAPARVYGLLVSDVMGGELAAIGSGPVVADPWTAAQVLDAIAHWHIEGLPASVLAAIGAAARGAAPEAPGLARAPASARVILDNAVALAAARGAAAAEGLRLAEPGPRLLEGEAAVAGRAFAREVAATAASLGDGRRTFVSRGGETTVTLPAGCRGRGGRCQEFALACALELAALDVSRATVLAAGTDGRDGPTDAAGAIVDAGTAERIRAAGRDPAADLAGHDAYPALLAAGALLRAATTGTNVNDLIMAVVG